MLEHRRARLRDCIVHLAAGVYTGRHISFLVPPLLLRGEHRPTAAMLYGSFKQRVWFILSNGCINRSNHSELLADCASGEKQ